MKNKKYIVHNNAVNYTALIPNMVASAYGVDYPIDCANTSVAIVELGGSYQMSDVVSYCNRLGINVPKMTNIVINGADQSEKDADGEVCLDIDVVAAVAPGADIIVIFAPNSDQGFLDGLNKALSLYPTAISISWGSPENDWTPEGRAALDIALKQAYDRSIPVFVASGDNGASDGELKGEHVDYPASSTWSIACGGTKLNMTQDGKTILSETVWTDGGGGLSAFYKPSSEQAPFSTKARSVPDVAGNADPDTGYLVDIDGNMEQIGGTSAVAPLYAALVCVAVTKGFDDDFINHCYKNPNVFEDINAGSNGYYPAIPGFDQCTGLGRLNMKTFMTSFKPETDFGDRGFTVNKMGRFNSFWFCFKMAIRNLFV